LKIKTDSENGNQTHRNS